MTEKAERGRLRYETDIIGHRPPFRYSVFKVNDSGYRCPIGGGVCDTRPEGVDLADQLARENHHNHLHASTVETHELFEAEAEVGGFFDDLPVAEPDRKLTPRRVDGS